MFPYITVWGLQISMTWLGIVVALFTFIASVFYYAQKQKVPFFEFFLSLPFFIVLIYVFGKYVSLLLEFNIVIIDSLEKFLFLLSPAWYDFHFVGIIFWSCLYLFYFLTRPAIKKQKHVWVDIFFMATSLSLIPLWLFLLLWDDFVWKATTWPIAVHSFITDSKLAKYSQVFPLGLFLSFASFISLLIKRLVDKKSHVHNGYIGFAFLFFFISFVFLFQNYPRRWVMKLLWFTADIKQYVAWWMMIVSLLCHIIVQKYLVKDIAKKI